MFYLTSCSIVKDEDDYVQEFVDIHRFLGVEHFLFFDRSKNPLSEKFKDQKDITVIHFPEPKRHAEAWMEGAKYFNGKSVWTQFIDIDQVLVPKNTLDLKEMMKDYEAFPAVGFNWHSFGNSGHETEDFTQSTYERYTKRALGNAGINGHLQTCAKPDQIIQGQIFSDPHHAPLINGQLQCNEAKGAIPFNSPFNVPPIQNIGFIAHYYTRSREYWAKKIAKQRADTGTSSGTMADFDHHQTYLNAEDDLTVKNIWDKANGR